MKTSLYKVYKMLLIAIIYSSVSTIFAQAPQKMSYQAVVRNAGNGLIVNANVGMRISVLQGTTNGTAVYVETQTAMTNANGLVTLEIGAGAVVSGTFASINWGANAYFIKTETDPTGGTNYTIVGTSQFLSVPYALFAANSGSSTNNWTTTGNNIANNNLGNVGIGTGATAPFSPLTVKKDGVGFTQEDVTGVSKIGFYTTNTSAYLQTHSNNDLLFATNNGATQMVLQKTTGNLGIGITGPTEKLEVSGKIKTTNLQVTTGAGAGKVLTSDAVGNATWQTSSSSNTGVLISKFGTQIIPNATLTKVLFNQENHDPSNAFNNSTGEWTIPSTGFYHMNATVTFTGITASASGSLEIDIYINGAALKKHFYPINIGAISIALDAPLVAGDIISVYVSQGTGSDQQINAQSVYSYFSGYRIY